MKAIWKFPLNQQANKIFTVEMPISADIIAFQIQLIAKAEEKGFLVPNPSAGMPVKAAVRDVEVPTIWAELNPKETETEMRFFMLVLTGYEISEERLEDLIYIGTAQVSNGIVLHLYEVIK